MDYQDFVLQLDRAPGGPGFVSRVIRSPAGEAEAPFENPISPAELDGLWQAALDARRAGKVRKARNVAAPGLSLGTDPLVAELSLEELGDRLFRALFRGPVHSCWARSLAESTNASEAGLRLKLQLNLADPLLVPLSELPWEYLFSLEHGGFLGLQRQTPISRHMRLPLPTGQAPTARPLRLLIVSLQPRSMSELTLGDEGAKIAEVIGVLPGVETLPLSNPGIEALRDTLLKRDFHVLHFMGHGDFDPGRGQGVLYFADEGGTAVPVSGTLLASHLAGLPSLRLVFLNACETARTYASAPFAGVATALLRAGLPAVIAMQRPIGDESALEFSRAAYRRIAMGDPIDAAVTEARLAIARGHGALLEWGTPVLFSRSDDGRLFAPEPVTAPFEPLAPVLAAPLIEPSAARPKQRLPALVLLAIVVVASLALATSRRLTSPQAEQEPIHDSAAPGPATVSESTVTHSTPTSEPVPEPKPIAGSPSPPKRSAVRPEQPQETKKKEAASPVSLPPAAYELSEGLPVSIPEQEATVVAKFFERAGRSFARFSVSPQGEGLLEQPPVLSTGTIVFPAQRGTYHLDVLSLDLVERRATVRLRFVSTTGA